MVYARVGPGWLVGWNDKLEHFTLHHFIVGATSSENKYSW